MIPLDPREQSERYTTSAFLSPYLAYSCSIHEAPASHHEAVAMALLSVMVGGHVRLRHFGGGDTLGNLWILLVGGPGHLKSESIRLGERIAGSSLKLYRYADDFSAEKMIADLATRSASRVAFIQDEAAYLFGQMQQDRNASMAQLLAKIYDGRELQQARQGKETLIAEDYFATFLGAIQPDAFEAHAKDATLRRGLLSRFIWIPAPQEIPTGRRVLWDREQENRLQNALGTIVERSGHCELRLSDASDQAFQAFVKAHHHWMAGVTPDLATLGIRFRALPLKLAILLYVDRAVAKDPTRPLPEHGTIPEDVFTDACEIALRWRQLLPTVFAEFAPNYYSKQYKRILKWIREHQPHARHSDLLRNLADTIKGDDVKKVIPQLREAHILSPETCHEQRGLCYHLDPQWALEQDAKAILP